MAGRDAPGSLTLRITRIDHVAVCVANIDHQLPSWLELLGLQPGAREYVDAQKTEAAFILTPETAGCTIELAGGIADDKSVELLD